MINFSHCSHFHPGAVLKESLCSQTLPKPALRLGVTRKYLHALVNKNIIGSWHSS